MQFTDGLRRASAQAGSGTPRTTDAYSTLQPPALAPLGSHSWSS